MKKSAFFWVFFGAQCLAAPCLLLACGSEDFQIGSAQERDKRQPRAMSPKERRQVDTNPLFAGVIDGAPLKDMDELLRKEGAALFHTNHYGDTPLGAAIKLKKKEMALFLLESFPCQRLKHQNLNGESYIYLAAKEGWPQFIHAAAGICYESEGDWFDGADYEFRYLDPKTKAGEKALHAAAHSLAAEALEFEYSKGWEEWKPFFGFYYHKDERGRIFLHSAAEDNRADLITWAVERECASEKATEEEGFWRGAWKWTADFSDRLSRPARSSFSIRDLFNIKDIESEDSPLHLAAKALNVEAITALASCRWTDFDSANNLGDVPLQSFLKSLDPLDPSHSSRMREAFGLLLSRHAERLLWPAPPPHKRPESLNKEGSSALHIAAKLADPYFYNEMKKTGDIHLKNFNGASAEHIFQSRRRELE